MNQSKPFPSHRAAAIQLSVIGEMSRLADETQAVNLTSGMPDFDPPAEILAAAMAAIQSGDNQYAFTYGTPAFGAAIAEKMRRYNRVPTDYETEVTVTCGVSEALSVTMLALTDPGDEVIILEPWYENYLPSCQMAGVRPHFVTLHEPHYAFDPDELRHAFNARTRLIIVNTPHNPTGKVFSRDELNVIATLCQEYNVIAVADEIYEQFVYDDCQHISLASLDGMQSRTVTVGGLGKTYAVTGWRLGWAVAAPPLTAAIRKLHEYLTICAPTPLQAGGLAALNLPQSYYTTMRQEYATRRAILLTALDEVGFGYQQPQGAYYVMADFSSLFWEKGRFGRSGWSDDRAFAEYLARQVGVVGVPGSSFYAQGKHGTTRLRFTFAKKEATLKQAAERLACLKND